MSQSHISLKPGTKQTRKGRYILSRRTVNITQLLISLWDACTWFGPKISMGFDTHAESINNQSTSAVAAITEIEPQRSKHIIRSTEIEPFIHDTLRRYHQYILH